MQQSMVRVLRPNFEATDNRGRRIVPEVRDYIEVPRLSTYGNFRIVEMIPMETLTNLYILQRKLSGVKVHAGRG